MAAVTARTSREVITSSHVGDGKRSKRHQEHDSVEEFWEAWKAGCGFFHIFSCWHVVLAPIGYCNFLKVLNVCPSGTYWCRALLLARILFRKVSCN